MTQQQTEVNYKETLNLPQTTFPMKAGAATREPEIQAFWAENTVYETAQASRDKNHKFVLHDGPPYLSSDKIHIGTALNKILKDIVTRYKYQRGYYAPYVPGYDGHGLPIENAVVKSIKGGRKAVSEAELRQMCREFGLKNLAGQEANFKRLGVWGHWAKPYLTPAAEFEALQIKLFFDMYEKGFVYQGLKPVYWSPASETALAEAEVEYADIVTPEIYVAFKEILPHIGGCERTDRQTPGELSAALKDASYVIWTTTPWTLPSNLALSVHPNLDYVVIQTESFGKLVVAKGLLESFCKAVGIESGEPLAEFKGQQIQGSKVQHPFIPDRKVPVLCGDHVTLDAGTGVVHTAPDHGSDDYLVCQEYSRDLNPEDKIGFLNLLDDRGCFRPEAGERLVGQFYEKANDTVLEMLKENNALLGHKTGSRSYPHDWRTKTPVITRATEQWFIDVNKFRKEALDAIKTVQWIPARGENRITSFVENRADWCISRQRVWGVPIPAFYDKATGEMVMTRETVAHLKSLFDVHSADIWWAWTPEQLLEGLPEETKLQLNLAGRELIKETDTLEVWFDSGITHTAVVDARKEELGELPVELYLEGSDQHRGWFQSALLTSVMLNGKAPYKAVLTHGFVLDPDGRKMSKSLGNVVDPNDVMKQYGADVLRLWVASVDYSVDVRIGDEIIKQLVEVYKKIRNTIRYAISNLADFDPAKDSVPYEQLSDLDKYVLHRLQDVVGVLTESFDQYQFHKYYQVLQNFCVVELSSLYFDVAKDILYCDRVDAPRRRAMQTVLYELLSTLLPMMVPVMPHLAEDIWSHLPEHQKPKYGFDAPPVSAVLAPWPEVKVEYQNESVSQKLEQILKLKTLVNLALEKPRAEGQIGNALEACVVLCLKEEALKQVPAELYTNLLLVSSVTVSETLPSGEWLHQITDDTLGTVAVARASDSKCQRCWNYRESVGQNAAHPALCARCAEAIA